MSLNLILIGYWRSAAEPHWPDPAWFVDDAWSPAERARVLAYLRGGVALWAVAGPSWCRFRCSNFSSGSSELSDGRFVWPGGLAHYVECHAVRPPDEFVAHALSGAPAADRQRVSRPVHFEDVSVDPSWWSSQRGFHAGESFLTPAPRGTFLARLHSAPPKPALLHRIRRFPEAQSLSYPDLAARLGGGEAIVLVSGVVEMPIPAEVAELEAAGFTIEFRPERS